MQTQTADVPTYAGIIWSTWYTIYLQRPLEPNSFLVSRTPAHPPASNVRAHSPTWEVAAAAHLLEHTHAHHQTLYTGPAAL